MHVSRRQNAIAVIGSVQISTHDKLSDHVTNHNSILCDCILAIVTTGVRIGDC